MPRQSDGREAASRLRTAAIKELQPLHDDLLYESPQSFDGIVSFATDKWYESTASAVATIQPTPDTDDRFTFYRTNIEHNRIDLAATAFGDAMRMKDPRYLQSRMNPDQHVTYAPRVVIDGRVIGGVQAAFNTTLGEPMPEETIAAIWQKHAPAVEHVMREFDLLAGPETVRSIGDAFELLTPTTPNAFLVSWDTSGSTEMALSDEHFGSLRDYLIDAKHMINRLAAPNKSDYHDNGDGQDMILWLPGGVDRADPASVAAFGHATVLPLLQTIQAAQQELVAQAYADLNPRIRFTIGLAHLEKNEFEGYTSRELWEIAQVMNGASRSAIGYTRAARSVLDIYYRQTKTPQ